MCKKAVQELELKKGRDNPDLAAMLNVLAVIYREQGKLKEATKVLQETLDIREKVFGVQHPAVASTLNNLSVLYGKCGDFKTAEPFCRKALEIRQKVCHKFVTIVEKAGWLPSLHCVQCDLVLKLYHRI